MSQTLKKRVKSQIQIHQTPPDNRSQVLTSTHERLSRLQHMDVDSSGIHSVYQAIATLLHPPKYSTGIRTSLSIRSSVWCVTRPLGHSRFIHFCIHNLNLPSYRVKFGVPSLQPLSSHHATAQSRQSVLQIGVLGVSGGKFTVLHTAIDFASLAR